MFKDDSMRIEFQQENPKRPGSNAFHLFEKYKTSRTVGEARKAGARNEDLKNDYEKEFLKVPSVPSERELPNDVAVAAKRELANDVAVAAKRELPNDVAVAAKPNAVIEKASPEKAAANTLDKYMKPGVHPALRGDTSDTPPLAAPAAEKARAGAIARAGQIERSKAAKEVAAAEQEPEQEPEGADLPFARSLAELQRQVDGLDEQQSDMLLKFLEADVVAKNKDHYVVNMDVLGSSRLIEFRNFVARQWGTLSVDGPVAKKSRTS